jgi:uncharacterized protein YjbI with pentapeptide repeats
MKQAWKKYLLYGSIVIIGLVLILAGYGVTWTGFGDYTLPTGNFVRGKTLWDWLELLIIPLVLAGGAFYLQRSERAVERKAAEDRAQLERELATDRQQEAALQAYLDRMAELLLNERSLKSQKVLNVARVRTLTTMRGLNAPRNGIVLRFLRDIGLVGKKESNLFVDANLEGADLKGVNLENTNMAGVSLKGANLAVASLTGANLAGAVLDRVNLARAIMVAANLERAILEDANLEDAILSRSNLKSAHLVGANLENVNLSGTNVDYSQLATAASLKGATMPDGTKYDQPPGYPLRATKFP